jgi:hypothetical protein
VYGRDGNIIWPELLALGNDEIDRDSGRLFVEAVTESLVVVTFVIVEVENIRFGYRVQRGATTIVDRIERDAFVTRGVQHRGINFVKRRKERARCRNTEHALAEMGVNLRRVLLVVAMLERPASTVKQVSQSGVSTNDLLPRSIGHPHKVVIRRHFDTNCVKLVCCKGICYVISKTQQRGQRNVGVLHLNHVDPKREPTSIFH